MVLVEEAKEKQKIEQSRSTKREGKVKLVGGKNAVKKFPVCKNNIEKLPAARKNKKWVSD